MERREERAKKIVIIGAGPAGLTAAYELLSKGNYELIILEKSHALGGLSRTVNYKGLRMDIGGHRFFSKSDVVMEWWQNILPIESTEEGEYILNYQGQKTKINIPASDSERGSMMVRNRRSSILYLRKRFDYPLNLSLETMKKFGFLPLVKISMSYFLSKFIVSKPQNLEQFFIKRFGKTLYLTFFKSYTEKVWGVPCNEISAEWGEQRIKKLSFSKALLHFFKSKNRQISQKNIETSLIERFLYPKLGPGQMWETVAEEIKKKGGKIIFGAHVTELSERDGSISKVHYSNNSIIEILEADEVISTMPVTELLIALPKVPQTVLEIGKGLKYRDFITVGVLVDRDKTVLSSYEDNWPDCNSLIIGRHI
jgi:protoporphyrinogen oxidase